MSGSIRARVCSIERITTPQGQRCYCVFQVPGRSDFALWSPDLGQFDRLEVGSEVPLSDEGNGQLKFDLDAWRQELGESNWPFRFIWSLL